MSRSQETQNGQIATVTFSPLLLGDRERECRCAAEKESRGERESAEQRDQRERECRAARERESARCFVLRESVALRGREREG